MEIRSTTPRWVKVSAIIGLVLVLVVGVMLVIGGPGAHGPGRHTESGDTGGQTPPGEGHTPPPGVTEGHSPPAGIPEHGAQLP